MKSNLEMLQMISSRDYSEFISTMTSESASIIKQKINEIPDTFFEPRFSIDGNIDNTISLIDFTMKTAGMSTERRNWLMEKYHISPYDVNKLQSIINSIKVASEYGRDREKEEKLTIKKEYGIALANEAALDKAYPLWIAYLYSDSATPLEDVTERLKKDGMDDKYKPEYIVGLMDHTNTLMQGKSIAEKKDFYAYSISGILEEAIEIPIDDEIEK